MKIKTFILTFLMMSCSIVFGQNSANVANEQDLKDAIAAGRFGEMSITLTDNLGVTERINIPVGYTITINLNGKTITANEDLYAFNNLGALTIKDNVGTGGIEARGIYNGANNPDGNTPVLKIESGIFKNNATNGGAAIYNYSKVIITGGEFYGEYAAITNRGTMEISNAFIEGLNYAAIVNLGELTYGDGVYMVGDLVDNYEGTTGTVISGEAIQCVARINNTSYASFSDALTAAKATTGDVTVQIYDAVEFVDGMELKGGNYTSITFIGKSDDAKMTINQSAGGDYIEAHGKTVAFENIALAKANPQWSGNSGHMGNYFSIQGGTATYTNCTFLNGACTSGGTATYNDCTFKNESEFGLWVYDDALVTVNNSVVDSYKGIKVYSEDETSVTSTLKVENTTFTSKLARPAVAIGYAVSVELIGNTYNNTTDVIELDSGTDADCEGITFVAQDDNGNDIASTLTAVDRSKNNARCGVLMDGKMIYTSVATAAYESKIGNTITLLYNTEETVELPAGVALDLNNYSAPNVTIDITGTLGKCYISEADERTRIYGEITGMLSVKESVVVDLYSGETKLATTTLAKPEYLTSNTLGVNIVIAGEASSSWNTEWHVAPIAHIIPNKAVLYLDGEEMNDAEVTLGTIDNIGVPYVWGDLTGVKPSPAMIGSTGYATLQDAINAAVNGDEIKLYETLEENVTVPQTPDVAITIDGNSQNYRGTITVDGGSSAYETAALTIKNFSFNAYSISKDAVINLGGTNPTRYTNHVTIENCDFRGNDANKNKVAVKSYTGGCKNLTITECTATGLHSLAQLYTTAGVTVEDCEITNSKSGISLTASSDVSISDVTMDVEKYGIRVDAGSAVTTKISDCDIKAYVPVIARKATGNYTFEFNGKNTMTPANQDGKFCVVDGGKNDYEDGDVNLEDLAAPTGFVMVTLNDANLSYEGVYGGHTHEAKIGDTRYVFLQDALDAVEAGEQPTTIEIIRDVTSDATVSQVEGENIIIDGNDYNFSGTIYVDGNSRSTGTETLTIQNFNFTTEKDSHDFISSNSTESEKRYAHNVTVKDCNFTATEESPAVVGMRFRQAYNINVEGGEFKNLHSVMWATGTSGATVKGIVATGCKEGGISFGTSTDLVVENAIINVVENENNGMPNYGIRVDASVATTLTVIDSEINAYVPVVARSASANYTMNFEGENTMTAGNDDNKWCVIGKTEYKTGAELPNDATGNVIVNLNDEGLSYDGVHGNFAVAKIGNVQYPTFAAALEAAQNGATIELIYKEGDAPIAMNGALYGKNVTVTGTATVDWSKGWLFIGRGGEGDAQLTFNKANLTSASDNRKYGINVSGKAATNGHAYNGTLRIEDHSNIEVDYIITRNRLVVIGASTLTAKNGFVLGGRPATETVSGNDATASVFLTNNAHIIVKGNKTTIGYEGKATIDLSTGGTSFKCYDHDVTITEKGIVNLDGATFNVAATGENAVKLVNNGTVNVKGNSSFDVKTIEGNAIVLNNATLANAYIGGAVNAFGTNNFTGETNVKGLFSVGYNNASAAPVVVNITGNFNGGNVLIGSSNKHVLNLGDAEGERTTANFSVQLGAFGDVNINNADVTYQYAFIRNNFNVINSTMEVTNVNTYIAGNAEVFVDNSIWEAGAYARIGEYDEMFGNADVTLKNGSVMTATNLNIILQEGKTVKVTIEDNSRLEATNLTNQGSIVLAGVDAKVTSKEFDNAPTTTVPYKKVDYVDGSYVVIDKDYVAQILDAEGNSSLNRRYESFAEALNEVQNNETIELINANTLTLDESKQKLTFERDIEFTITGNAPNYALPIVTFQNATVNIKDANFQIPELDARKNATINVKESIVKSATGNPVVKSYYNGRIIIDGSEVYTHQATTMGYIDIINGGKLNVTWQTNVYGNGLITVKGKDSEFKTAAFNLTAEDYKDRDNTDTDRVGKPATVIVDGATLIAGNVYSASGADYSYETENYGINIGTEGKAALLDIKNGATVEFYMKPQENSTYKKPVIGADGIVNVNASTFNVKNRDEAQTLELANNGTVYVTGAANLDATVTGDGWFYMNGVTLDADTELLGAKVGFINGENNIVGSTIDNGFFSVGIGQNAAATTAADFAEANGITLGNVTVNVSENAIIGGNGESYSGWVGSAYSAVDKTQHTYTLNVENSLAAFGYMHVSKDGIMNIDGRSADDNKYTQDNSNVNFYAGDLIVNGNVTINDADAWVKFTKMSVDHADGVLNITGDTKYESSIHNGGTTRTSLVFYKAGKVNIANGTTIEIDNATTLVEGAELNIASANVIAKGDVTGNGTINFTSETATLTVPTTGLTVNNETGNNDIKVVYENGTYKFIDKHYVAEIVGGAKYESLAEAATAAQDGETIKLLWNEGDAAISMAATFVGNKTVTITGTANVDWSKGFFFVGRNGEGDGKVIFDNANLTSVSNSSAYGFNVSGSKVDDNTTNDGIVEIKNSTIVLDYMLNKNVITLDNSTLTVKNGFSVTGRKASESATGEDATATMTLSNNSKVVVNNMNGMGIGHEAYGIMNIDATSTFETTQGFNISAKGTMNVNGGNVSVTSIVNAGTINVTGASVLSATVTGEGSVNMSDVALAETTNLNSATNNVVFKGENNINAAKIVANEATVVDGKLSINEGADVKFVKLTVNKQLSISRGKLNVTYLTNDGITSINYEESIVKVSGITTNNNVLNISNKAVYKTEQFVNNSENLNVSSNSKLEIGAARFAEKSTAKVSGEVSVSRSVVQEENAVIRLTDAAARFTTTDTKLNVVTTVADSKVVYTDGAYVVVAKHYVAYIGETGYESLQEAFDAAEVEGTTIELSYNEGDAPISMNASLYGKNVTITGTATVDWAGWLYVGRGGIGNAELTFKNANLTSRSSGEGINVSCAKNTDESVCNGKVVIKNSTIELPEFLNRNIVEVENSTITTTHLTSGGRPANETADGSVATAEFTLTNSVLNALGNITNGYEGIGVMTVDAKSNVKVNGTLSVKVEGSTLNSAGNITGAIVKAEAATIQLTGGIYTTEPQEGWCAENYGAFPYDETSWIVREVYGTQTIALQAGWNWVSTYIEQFGEKDGLAMLQNGLGDNGDQIKNNFAYSTNFGGEIGWFGELEETSELQMYMVNVFESQDLRLEGDYVNYEAEDNAIELNHGWNWIAYSVSEEINISDALSNLEATTGDIIKTMGASAVYLNGNWVSSNLKSLKPGSGYMYKNNGEFTSFNYSSRVTTTPSGSADNRANNHWTADIAQYPNNMTMIAMTDVEGDNYEVAAFVNGEVRGSARPVYVEELNAYILVLTISGDDVAEVSFMYYDLTTGEEVEFSNRINYSNDAIVGSITEPYMLTRRTTGIGESAMSQVNIYPNPTTTGTEINLQTVCDTVEVFNALGVKVAEYQNVDSIDAIETAGIYVIRITNDGNIQNCRLVVK